MGKRIRDLLVITLVLSHLLLLSCSSSVNQGGTQNVPAAPTHVRLAVVAQGLEAAWDPVAGSTHYTLFWGTEPGDYKSLVNCESPAVILSRLNSEQLYFFAVTAWNQRGESNFSNEQVLVYDDRSGRPETYLAIGYDLMNRGHYSGAHAYFPRPSDSIRAICTHIKVGPSFMKRSTGLNWPGKTRLWQRSF